MTMAGEQMSWSRLEPRARDSSLAPGLEARVHDALWLLARQWQFGELSAGSDLGTAVLAEVVIEVAPLARFRPGRPDDGAATEPYDPAAAPLEARVEAEDPLSEPTARLRARAGLQFERLLVAHGVGSYAAAYRAAYALAGPDEPGDAPAARFLAVVGGRVLDGKRLYDDMSAALRPTGGASPALPPEPVVEAADADAVGRAAESWLEWYDELYVRPTGTAWVGDRMEYVFGLAAPSADGEGIALEVDEHTDGRLDWYGFSAGGGSGPTDGAVQVDDPATMIPTPVTYPGMPAQRLWEFEDANVSFGDVEAQPEDLGRLLLTQFALIYGGDWLLVPIEVPAGSLVRVHSLVVSDTFGQRVRIAPATAIERAEGDWRMFTLSPGADGLLVAPVLVSALRGRDLEEVLLLRDETANLAWAVERTVEGAHGLPVDRAQAEYARRPGTPPPAADGDVFTYRLMTDVPEHWLPLLPRRAQPGDPATTLELGSLPRVLPDGSATTTAPLGRVLQPPGLTLREEEVPREGARVTRGYRMARWVDGTTFLWLSRRKQVGRGEGSSSLRFDAM